MPRKLIAGSGRPPLGYDPAVRPSATCRTACGEHDRSCSSHRVALTVPMETKDFRGSNEKKINKR